MARTDLNNSDGTNERSSLITGSKNATRQNSSSRRSSGYLNEGTKNKRFRDIRINYFGMFVSSIVFSITVSSLWPFLQQVDKTAEATFLGWLVAAFSLGQLIASPILGYVANRTNDNKMPLSISTALIVVANILYAYVESIHTPGFSNKWWLILSRFIMGVGAANSAVMRSYASSATTLAERTAVMANLSACQGIGFILGPLIQALFGFLGKYPAPFHRPWLQFNIYTAPAFFGAFTAAVNLVLFLFVFKDTRAIAIQRKSINGNEEEPQVSSDEQSNQLWAIICCLYLFFVAYLTFTNYETIASPLSIDMYAWSKEKSAQYNGYILGALGAMSVVVLIVSKILVKRFQYRVLLLFGMLISFVGYFVFLPWGTDYPYIQIATYTPTTPTTSGSMNVTTTTISTTTGDTPGGCPMDYPWCYYVPRVQLWQYILASVIITTGFTVCNVICYSIYSKKLGERPQGTMMGLFNSAGALARAFGPIVVGFLYKHWGPRVMMIFMLVFVLSGIIVLLVNYGRLGIEPEVLDDFSDTDEDEENKIQDNGDDRLNSNNNITD